MIEEESSKRKWETAAQHETHTTIREHSKGWKIVPSQHWEWAITTTLNDIRVDDAWKCHYLGELTQTTGSLDITLQTYVDAFRILPSLSSTHYLVYITTMLN